MLLSFLCLFSIDAVSKDGLALRLFKYAGVLAGLFAGRYFKSQTFTELDATSISGGWSN